MFKIISKQILAEDVKRLDILAPGIARKVRPGQFVSVSPEEGDERIPLTVVDHDAAKGTITLIFQEVGYTTQKLGSIQINEEIFSILGPLGNPAPIAQEGIVICIATGTGIAQILPVCRAYAKAGNRVIGIIGAKTKSSLILQSQMRLACYKLFTTTNDGSFERKGLATDVLKEWLMKQPTQLVYAVGSLEMMQAVSSLTREENIKTRVVLNPIMVDCMGLCGSCRVKVAGQMVLSCIDGPEFDGHQVDFADLNIRMNAFKPRLDGAGSFDTWQESKKPSSPKSDETKTLTKFLSGFLKS